MEWINFDYQVMDSMYHVFKISGRFFKEVELLAFLRLTAATELFNSKFQGFSINLSMPA